MRERDRRAGARQGGRRRYGVTDRRYERWGTNPENFRAIAAVVVRAIVGRGEVGAVVPWQERGGNLNFQISFQTSSAPVGVVGLL